jgi:hypothetical protein
MAKYSVVDQPNEQVRRAPDEEKDQLAISWGAIVAGGRAAAALTLTLLAFGSAMGFSSVSPWPHSGISASSFQIATGLYLIVTAMLSSTIGGYITGRLRTKWGRLHSDETIFRDTAHGFLAWALATVLGVAALGAAATSIAGGFELNTAEGISRSPSASTIAYFADLLLRPGSNSAQANVGDDAGARAEVGRILARGLAQGSDFPSDDRSYLAQIASSRVGLARPDAEKRAAEVIDRARSFVDSARKAAAALALWLAISMLVGAFSASAAAIEGGQLRDGRWKAVIGSRRYQGAPSH